MLYDVPLNNLVEWMLHNIIRICFFFFFRLPVVSECSPQQTARVSVAAGSSGSVNAAASAAAAAAAAVVAGAPSSSTMSVSRVPSPPPSSEANTPVAENWCYTQVRTKKLPTHINIILQYYMPIDTHYNISNIRGFWLTSNSKTVSLLTVIHIYYINIIGTLVGMLGS